MRLFRDDINIECNGDFFNAKKYINSELNQDGFKSVTIQLPNASYQTNLEYFMNH